MRKKYYVEFVIDELADYLGEENYFAQSGWKESEEEALEWATQVFHYFFTNFDYEHFTNFVSIFLMSGGFDDDDDLDYGDIHQESRLFYDYHYHKVVKEKDIYIERIPF